MIKEKIDRKEAIKAFDHLFEQCFGNDKGSREMYEEWCENEGLTEVWDGESDLQEGHKPPGTLEFLLALGVSPQEIVDILHINHEIFDEKTCSIYGFMVPHE